MFSKSAHMGLYGCLLLVVIACGLPGSFAAGGSCYAGPMFYGPTCNSDTAVFGHQGYQITYSVDVIGDTLICCEAYFCSGSSCSLGNVGCGHGSWSTFPLTWGNNAATPKMRCYGNPLGSVYTFTH